MEIFPNAVLNLCVTPKKSVLHFAHHHADTRCHVYWCCSLTSVHSLTNPVWIKQTILKMILNLSKLLYSILNECECLVILKINYVL